MISVCDRRVSRYPNRSQYKESAMGRVQADMGRFQCWVDPDEKILSFHMVEGYRQKAFQEKEELVAFALRAVKREQYRIQ